MAHFDAERTIVNYQVQTLIHRVGETIYGEKFPVTKVEMAVTGRDRGPERAPKTGWKKVSLPLHWGGLDQTTWFKLHVKVPEHMKGHQVTLEAKPGGEALIYVNGEPRQGHDPGRLRVFVTKKAKGGETFEVVFESVPSTQFDIVHSFDYAHLQVFHPQVWEFYWDLYVPWLALASMPENGAPRRQLLDLLENTAAQVERERHPEPAYFESLVKAQTFFRKGLKNFEASDDLGTLTLAGHSHLDTAWLWPVRETKRKAGRTWANMLDLMDDYDDFHFVCSQPAQYEWAKTHFPELYARAKKRIKEGRWEPIGCMWVEPDLNVPSGESLVRQCLFGKRFFREEFGKDVRIAWTPDTFGYTYALPQILSKCGVDTYMTTKIHWNQYTKFPYSLFHWEGLDGSRVLTFMPVNYNGFPDPAQLVTQWEAFQQKDRCDEFVFPFGHGDGGGGPSREMLEHGRRLQNLSGIPRTRFGRVDEAVDRMKEATDLEALPVYNGELFFELHRGCQTSQARTKRNNRKAELLLRNAELISTMAAAHGAPYEQNELNSIWKTVLTNQFHDILPGTSLTEVYTTCDAEYADVLNRAAAVRDRALAALAAKIDTTGEGAAVLVFNDLPWMRDDVVRMQTKLPKGAFAVLSPEGLAVPHQIAADGALLFEARDLPPLGYAVYRIVSGADDASASELKVSAKGIENDYLRVKLDSHGRITSLFDKLEGREIVPKGQKANVLQLFRDQPGHWDAWDIDFNFMLKSWEPDAPVSVEVVEEGPVRAIVRVVRTTNKSTITQDITLYADGLRVDFDTHVDWQETWTLLKAAFPIDVRSTRATFEIQYGAIERPTHRNEPADAAKFEVPAQRWADLSEGDYGVSILNDCKYGYDALGNLLRISLLRSPTLPDGTADKGEHRFTYSVYPHTGDWRAGTVQEALELNCPLLAVDVPSTKGKLPAVSAFATVDAENLILDAVKKCEDSKSVIVRLYEAYGQRGRAMIRFGQAPRKVVECDLMEENEVAVKHKGANVELYVKPYEIRTLKVTF
jgi:alpha-mannosidase